MYSYIMQRTQISLSESERRLLDEEAARTGRSIAALIRDAVDAVYGPRRSVDDDLRDLRASFGAWSENDVEGEDWVERLRSGGRTDDIRAS
jgi:Ribbon-helix-helix protein, copG family.